MPVRVCFYGVRGSTPASGSATQGYGGNSSCVVVEDACDRPIIFDAGTGLPVWGNTVPSGPFQAALLLTHLHLDHIQGLRFFSPLHGPDAELDIYGPPQDDAVSLEAALTRLLQPPFHPLRLSDRKDQIRCHEVMDTEFEVGGATVSARSVPHLGPTLGFRVDGATVDGVRRSVAYISDHQAPADLQAMDKGVLELATDVDLLIHDAQYTPVDWETKSTWGHSTVTYSVRVACAAGARRLALFHHDPWRTDDEIDRLLGEAQDAADRLGKCEVLASREGVTVDLA